jgi:hypothetical protein
MFELRKAADLFSKFPFIKGSCTDQETLAEWGRISMVDLLLKVARFIKSE